MAILITSQPAECAAYVYKNPSLRLPRLLFLLSPLSGGESRRSLFNDEVDSARGAFNQKESAAWSDHPVEAEFLSNLRRPEDHQARLTQEQSSSPPNLLLQGLRQVFFV